METVIRGRAPTNTTPPRVTSEADIGSADFLAFSPYSHPERPAAQTRTICPFARFTAHQLAMTAAGAGAAILVGKALVTGEKRLAVISLHGIRRLGT